MLAVTKATGASVSDEGREAIEAVGDRYDRQIMLEVRERTRRAIHAIAARISPGMVEEDAVVMARSLLAEAELLRGWHGIYVRFGSNTQIPYGASSEPGRVLGENDIFFIDIGPIWRSGKATEARPSSSATIPRWSPRSATCARCSTLFTRSGVASD